MSSRSKAAAIIGAVVIATTSIGGVFASSHREAPIIANYVPLQEPAGGPNFFPFDDSVRYEIHIDNNGDARTDIRYDFRFKTRPKVNNFAGIPTFLYNDGPITSLTDENWLVPQTYNVDRNGVRIEDNVVITETGADVLSDMPREIRRLE